MGRYAASSGRFARPPRNDMREGNDSHILKSTKGTNAERLNRLHRRRTYFAQQSMQVFVRNSWMVLLSVIAAPSERAP
jgi:hypothetical protein